MEMKEVLLSKKLYRGTNKEASLFKLIFENKQLLCEFLNSFIDIKELNGINPEDIEDANENLEIQYRKNCVLKQIRLKGHNKEPVFIMCLYEYQIENQYLIGFDVLEYMVLLWESYIQKVGAEEQKGNKNAVYSENENFKLPPIVPIIIYEEKESLTSDIYLLEKLLTSIIFDKKYIPQFKYETVNLNNYKKEDLLKLNNMISLIFLISKIESLEELVSLKQLPKEYFENMMRDAKKETLEILIYITMKLCRK